MLRRAAGWKKRGFGEEDLCFLNEGLSLLGEGLLPGNGHLPTYQGGVRDGWLLKLKKKITLKLSQRFDWVPS